jgi:hypothetical protein
VTVEKRKEGSGRSGKGGGGRDGLDEGGRTRRRRKGEHGATLERKRLGYIVRMYRS